MDCKRKYWTIHWVCNSSYSFMSIFLKLYRCFCPGLKMCMWFGYNPQINFDYFFRILNLVIFQACILSKCIDSRHLWCSSPHSWHLAGASMSHGHFSKSYLLLWGKILIILYKSLSFLITSTRHLRLHKQYEPPHNKTNKMACLIRVFAVRSMGS